jgi:RNA polymerase sigma-70 factor (ECF subfamily)
VEGAKGPQSSLWRRDTLDEAAHLPGDGAAASDEVLIRRAQRGDREAFGLLVYRYREGAVNVVYRMCGDAQLAEDAAHDAFVRAWDALPRYRHRGTLKAWLYRIALNCARDVLRRRRPTVDVALLPLRSDAPDPERQMVRRERAEQVQEAVLRLPEASRAALILREYGGLSYKEIAQSLDLPIGTVMSRLHYARSRLREMLSPLMEDL